jgi:hypothetical protein
MVPVTPMHYFYNYPTFKTRNNFSTMVPKHEVSSKSEEVFTMHFCE